MRMHLTLMLCLLWSWAQAQYDVRPSSVVQMRQQSGIEFEPVRLFTPSNNLRSGELNAELKDYRVLTAPNEQIAQLRDQATDFISLTLPSVGPTLQLDLYRTEVLSEDFNVYLSSAPSPVETDEVVHYRGVIQGDEASLVAISISDQGVNGIISSGSRGNLVLGKLNPLNSFDGDHIIYREDDLKERHSFACETEDSGIGYSRAQLSGTNLRSGNKCLQLFLEVDNDVFKDKGGVNGTVSHITGLFNEVATLYANEGIKIEISEMLLWDRNSPYSGNSTYDLLRQFQNTRKSIKGDLGQLLTYKASGGIAVVDGLCRSNTAHKLSVVSIGRSYQKVPNYSFSVVAMAHEFGHLLGSQHTHACVWNGNNTAIDGCPGYVEGSCNTPGRPGDGGTIMSYCHITSVGINLNKGFGPQPGNLMRYNLNGAGCLTACSTPPPSSGGGGNGDAGVGTCKEVTLTIYLDLFGSENSWEITDEGGKVIGEGGPYMNKTPGKKVVKTYCLPEGCYDFDLFDAYGDGLCCEYGNGSFNLVDADGNVLATDGSFGYETNVRFCIENSSPGGGDSGDNGCIVIDFEKYAPKSYGGSQDRGELAVTDDNKGLYIENNAWKGIDLTYEITENTKIEFEFASTRKGEIHGIGFDRDNGISSSLTFQLAGTQRWGIQTYKNYPDNKEWKKYVIPVGQFYTGTYNRMFFAADHDGGSRNGNSSFRHIKIYEGSGCSSAIVEEEKAETAEIREIPPKEIVTYPIPADTQFNILMGHGLSARGTLVIYNSGGAILRRVPLRGNRNVQVNVSDFPIGNYFYRLQAGEEERSGKFTIYRGEAR